MGTTSGSSSSDHGTKDTQISAPRRFLVHFRRPIKEGYNGSYGFDWLRDEYIYDIKQVIEAGPKPKRLYRGNVHDLIKEYTTLKPGNSTLSEVTEIGNTSEAYIPAWLGIFPDRSEVELYLQIDQLTTDDNKPLSSNDSTVLEFSTSPGIVVSPTKIALKKLITKGQKSRKLVRSGEQTDGENGYSRNIKYYVDESIKISIKATSSSNKARFIKVIAKRGKYQRKVGVLMIYPNSNIPNADIVVVHFCTKSGATTVPTPPAYQHYLKYRSLNQALVRGEVKGISRLNVADEKNNHTRRSAKGIMIRKFLEKYPPNTNVSRSEGSNLKKDIVKLYELFSEKYVPSGGIEGANNKKTFVIFTDYKVKTGIYTTLGSAQAREKNMVENLFDCTFNDDCFSKVWGNAVVLFDQGNTQLDTFAHELGHSFSLPHTFASSSLTRHSFYQGYTDNLMDYSYLLDRTGKESGGTNPYKHHMWSLFKWQWDLLRKDRSIR
ncbi:M12 family metallo-peptidase [Psychrobacter sp. AOP7-D1-15]|uniref:M12 family metallo-peptidase n=1 Tax=unclassified Psychrobacter TaxID=196806 RepID=UPI0018684E20|nr:M12 family metallo-peptidase [Psychrobacter sp. FME61]